MYMSMWLCKLSASFTKTCDSNLHPKWLKTKQAVVDIFDNEDQTDSIHTSVRQAVSSWTPNLILKNPAGRE